MNNSVCNIVLIQQFNENIQPYHLDSDPSYEQLLKSNFSQVCIEQDPLKAIETIKRYSQPTLLLVDLDAIEFNENHKTRHDYIIEILKNITRDLNELLPLYIPLIVCSKDDSSNFMLDCIHAGAVDYLLKPLCINVIKTLFLKLYQNKPNRNTLLTEQQSLPSPTTTYQPLYDRINEMNSKDSHLSKVLVDIFLPKHTEFMSINHPNITKTRSDELELKISSWGFSPFELNQQELIHCVYLIFNHILKYPELQHISMSKAKLYDFIIDLASVYHDENPYHNFAHAVDVLQCLFYMLCKLNVIPFKSIRHISKRPQDLLRPKDVFALLIAAIGHDAAHPGVNNMFLINSSNPLATLYNDRSVLESLHSMTLFQLLNKHGITQLIGDPKSNEYKEFRKIVVSSILATDMALHLDYVKQIKSQAIRFKNNQLDQEGDAERILLCSALIKCADISNVARPFRWGTQWAELLVKEFIYQGDLERELGMPVLPMNDRTKVVMEDSQIGFIRFVALDLFQNVREILMGLSFAVDQMQTNLKQWEARKQQVTLHDSGVSNLQDDEPMLNDFYQEEDEFDMISNDSTARMMIETGSKRSSSSLDYYHDVKRISIEKPTHSSHYDQFELEEFDNRKKKPIYCRCTIQ